MRLLAFAFLLASPALAHEPIPPAARLLHEEMIVLDTHLDIPSRFDDPDWDFGALHHHDLDRSQTDLPRMALGGLDGGFFVIFTRQGELTPAGYRQARDHALARAAAIHRTLGRHHERIGLAVTAADAERLHDEGRAIAFISIENSYPLGEDLSLLGTFRELGVRMAGPVHGATNQLADSATGEESHGGLSALGRRWVEEANRLGIVIDASHASDAAFDDMLELSRAPIVLSHSGPEAIFDHPRNIDDARLRRLAERGGVLFVNSLYLVPPDFSDERRAIADRQREWPRLSPAERRQVLADKAAYEARMPPGGSFELFMESLVHAIEVMGADHVGLGADWDGGGGVPGFDEVSDLPKVTAALLAAGHGEEDIAKVMGGNLLRVLRAAEAAAER
ncbi:MAG: dipeptidase [Sphingomonadaceae bacterium]